jgi:hypothetical protein
MVYIVMSDVAYIECMIDGLFVSACLLTESSSEDDSSLTDMDKLNKSLRSLTFDILHSLQHGDKINTKTSK